ncbi:MAG: NAD(+) synthase [Parcubacteria group bacterium]|nr:NAD(+) synthase [Parcubacteria group bacterium]
MTQRVQTARGRSSSFGFARVATATFWTKPKGVAINLKRHLEMALRADAEKIQLMAFPELGLSGYGCRNAFRQRGLQIACLEALETFCLKTADIATTFVLGLPLALDALFNVAAVVSQGQVIAFIPKSYLAGRSEWQENEWFSAACDLQATEVKLEWQDTPVPIGTDILIPFVDRRYEDVFTMGIEICEDGWQTPSPADRHAHNGATVIVNLSASNWVLGKDTWREVLFPANSGRQKSVYIYAIQAGDSTSSVVWDGHSMIIEDGRILASSKRWMLPGQSELLVSDIDIGKLMHDRNADDGWRQAQRVARFPYRFVTTEVRSWFPDTKDFRRELKRLPFVPSDPTAMEKVGRELFNGLGQGVIGRLWHLSKDGEPVKTFMGLSGGLDSCLADLVTVYSYDRLGWSRQFFTSVRLPGPASGDESQDDSLTLARALGTGIHTADITELATAALKAAGHDPCWKCTQCENAQARARTFVLKTLGFNLGTGDMSEAAKGWCTEGGDQSSHFHVIANIPKTLVQYLVQYYIEYMTHEEPLKEVLMRIVNRRISPELVQVAEGEEIQSSEDKMGPYPVTDFYMHDMMRTGAEPRRMAFLAETAFGRKEKDDDVIYDRAFLLKWMRDWYIKFDFAQFKRNASPDSVLVASLGLGAHDKWRWPSDGDPQVFVDEVDAMIAELEAT